MRLNDEVRILTGEFTGYSGNVAHILENGRVEVAINYTGAYLIVVGQDELFNISELFRKRGIFYISRVMIENRPESILLIMAKVIVVRAEMQYMVNGIMYEAYSHEFEEVSEGCITPTYDARYGEEENSIQFVKQI